MATLQVFVSHNNDDSAFCHALVQRLRGAGADVWYDEHNMGSGMLLDTIEQEIRKRPVFIVILSPSALRSQWVRDECKWAYMRYKRDTTRIIQPVLAGALPDEDEIPLYLQDFKRIEASGLQPLTVAEATRRLLHTLALTPAGAAPAPVAPQPRESGDDLLERGKALIAQQRYAEALPLIERATQLLPDSSSSWANLGYALSELMRWAEVLVACDRALALDPSDAATWSNKGQALLGLGRDAEALEAQDRALVLDPTNPIAWNNKGIALNNLGRYLEALPALDQALSLDSAWAPAWRNKGVSLNDLQRYAEALRVYERSLTLDAQSARGWNGKARALRGLGRVAEAEAAERRAKELGG